jgi:hypothetical protein
MSLMLNAVNAFIVVEERDRAKHFQPIIEFELMQMKAAAEAAGDPFQSASTAVVVTVDGYEFIVRRALVTLKVMHQDCHAAEAAAAAAATPEVLRDAVASMPCSNCSNMGHGKQLDVDPPLFLFLTGTGACTPQHPELELALQWFDKRKGVVLMSAVAVHHRRRRTGVLRSALHALFQLPDVQHVWVPAETVVGARMASILSRNATLKDDMWELRVPIAAA